ncbi:MAG: FAD-dependent oxidoreductase [Vicingaceae bacterium]
MKHIAIIGNGISGVTAARHIRKKSDYQITIISAETKHFFSRTALMYVYMGHMRYQDIKPYEDHFWAKNRIELKQAYVTKVKTKEQALIFSDGEKMTYDELIIASGSKPRFYNWPGQALNGVQGLYSWQDLESMQENTKGIKKAVIVGGGLIGVEMAEMLRSRGIEVTFLVRDKHFWGSVLPKEEGQLISRQVEEHGVQLMLETELEEIIDDGSGKVEAVKTKNGERIDCQFVGLTTGVQPNIDFLKQSEIDCKRGVLVDELLRTNIENIYAIGDCAEFLQHPTGRKNIEQVWYTGKMMGETVAQTICGSPTKYQPGVWFNSAKFFDIEYQTYGYVWPKPKENESHFYWESEEKEKCLRFVYDTKRLNLLALHAFGIRLRHEVVDNWIQTETPIDQVIQNLRQANFDAEFYPKHEKLVQKAFTNRQKQTA